MAGKQIKISKLAIANRGEVAVRIIRACQELGIQTVLLHAEADRNSKAYRLADETFSLGEGGSSQTYLDIPKNIQGALKTGAQAIHPGFGFLSENADFAQACAKVGIIFVGPKPESIRMLGDKISARKILEKMGLPTVRGYHGQDQDVQTLRKEALRIGFPLIIKAAAGGGGRGMKVVREAEQFEELLGSAQREALSGFGSSQVFLERYLEGAKHIEFQIFGDSFGKVLHFFDRECSVQRRHQKIIEEAPSPSLSTELRLKMAETAVVAAKAANYEGAGTVEFLLKDGEYFFLEMNTRLQVEHPVTEAVLGLDLVKLQIKVAQGEPLPFEQNELSLRGHAIECRLYAEDSEQQGIPSTGVLGPVHWPEAPGRRFEAGFEMGDEITPLFDPMIAKIITWDMTRELCLQKMMKTLSDSIIFGVKTNIPYLKAIISHPEFQSGKMTTQFINQYFPQGLTPRKISAELEEFAKKANLLISDTSSEASQTIATQIPDPFLKPWGFT